MSAHATCSPSRDVEVAISVCTERVRRILKRKTRAHRLLGVWSSIDHSRLLPSFHGSRGPEDALEFPPRRCSRKSFAVTWTLVPSCRGLLGEGARVPTSIADTSRCSHRISYCGPSDGGSVRGRLGLLLDGTHLLSLRVVE
jgi:hypothetical protein